MKMTLRLLRLAAALCVARGFVVPPRASPVVRAVGRRAAEDDDGGADDGADDGAASFDVRTLSYRDKVARYNRPPEDSGLLSERWKEAETEAAAGDGGGGGGPVGGLAKAAGLAALAAFALVPVGDQTVGIPANDATRVPVTNFKRVDS